ncbi:MAG TPA: DHA2 family efflux MFS transporter permease subunit, partial [Cellulomonas sp.]|nr:DHA2 family efflux MFS transporter permease subunit [Cellulomonas sp.]
LVSVGWVNSAYLLTFAVLLLVTGRLGDRFGPRPAFVAGLVVFTLTSLACGLAPSIGFLIAARALQGIGAALMTPQTMSMITRVFPAAKRGAAMGVWGATAGVATIAGPVLGGALVESWGWEWIFFVNIPIGIVALWLSVTRLPTLPTHTRSFDLVGVALSVIGMFLLVFGLQEGETYDWGTVWGPITVWGMVGGGLVVLIGFVLWQRHLGDDALMPLRLFHVRNFSLANIAGWSVTFAMTGLFFPFTIFLQTVLGLTPLHAALVGLPGSLLSGIVAPFAGRLSDRVPAKWIVSTGFAILVVVVAWLALVIDADAEVWTLVLPMAFFGIGTGFLFSPLASAATAGLDHRTAGAGAGAFNTNRQIGGVIGSAAVVAMLTSRLSTTIPASVTDAAAGLPQDEQKQVLDSFASMDLSSFSTGGGKMTGIPDVIQAAVHSGFATAVSQTLFLTVGALALGLVASLAMKALRPEHHGAPVAKAEAATAG